MSRHHVFISGTGRTGTTFLVQLLTRLGFDTGFSPDNFPIYTNCNAGLELDILQEDAPYIVKNPWLCDNIQEVLDHPDIIIDHAFIPVRDLKAAAQSRIYVETNSDPSAFPEGVPGGLWHASDPSEQESVLATQFYKLIYHLSISEIPLTFIHYPRLAREPEYLYQKLKSLLKLTNIAYKAFEHQFHLTVRPELIHKFSQQDL